MRPRIVRQHAGENLHSGPRGGTVEGMRALLLSIAIFGCGPKVAPDGPGNAPLDEDLPRQQATPTAAVEVAPPRAEAPVGAGARSGTIERQRLVAVLDAGPGMFLRQVEVSPKLEGERFVGWQLVQVVDKQSPLSGVDLVPGDILLAVNGSPIARPDQLQTVWDSLRTATKLEAQLWRGDKQLTLAFEIR